MDFFTPSIPDADAFTSRATDGIFEITGIYRLT